ncbi:MAG: DUF3293 domain-containing protein [Candidatus Omnitrophica bacterium]|nr:DUF3293 domain-containing protein [Candidatus Omnitrophota bacterium]
MDHIGVFNNKILDAYRNTTFWVTNQAGQLVSFVVKNSQQFPILKQKQFAVITAFNPMNVVKSDAENNQNHLLLAAELKKRSHVYYPTSGSLGDHVEESFTIEDIPQEEAVALGKQFAQYAILFNDVNGSRFIRC